MIQRPLVGLLVAAFALGGCGDKNAPARGAGGAGGAGGATGMPALTSDDPQELIAGLKAGNERYRKGEALHGHRDAARRASVATSQKPKIAVLACADSRVAPEILFDQGLGDLFVVRVAGNTTTDEITASLEYTVEHLGTKLIVVLGHERCGAVKAAMAGGQLPGHLPALMARIQPAVDAVPASTADRENAVIAANARLTAELLAGSQPLLKAAVDQQRACVVAAVYDLDTGIVTFLPMPTCAKAPAAR